MLSTDLLSTDLNSHFTEIKVLKYRLKYALNTSLKKLKYSRFMLSTDLLSTDLCY